MTLYFKTYQIYPYQLYKFLEACKYMLGANWMHAKNIQYTVLVFNIADMSIWSTSIWSTKTLMIKIQ